MEKQFDKVVHLEKAGTLKKFISNDEIMTLESLKIIGKINKQDFDDVIEEMCDAFCWYDDDDCLIIEYDDSPKLRVLDMGECMFEGGNILPDFDPKILRELILPQGIEYLGTEYECSISECEDLERLVLPEGLKEIKDVFWCPKLKEVNIPLSVRKIEHSFLTTSLTEVFIHKYVEEISDGSFICESIKKIVVDSENKYIKFVDGVIFSADMKKLISFTGCCLNKKYVIPDGVEEIGYMAFQDSNVEEVVMPNTLKKIDTFAFQSVKLRYVEIPDSVIEVGDCAFRFCIDLESVKLSNGLERLNAQLFSSCPKLKRLEIPASVKVVDYKNFVWCNSLEEIIFNEGLEKIEGGGAHLARDGHLTKIKFPKTLKSLPGGAFSYCTKLKAFEIEEGNPYYCVVDGVIYTKDMKKIVVVPNRNRKSFSIQEGVEEIDTLVFYEFRELTTIDLPTSLIRIGHRAFDSCSMLEEICLHENIKEIDFGTFNDCKSLKIIKIEAENPPKLIDGNSNWTFTYKPENITLIVPKGAKSKYLRLKEWRRFNIKEY